MYWLHIEIAAKATLEDLDSFLRAVWLECCGHLSSFEIAGESFISEKIEPGDRSMNIALEKVMAPGMKFEYIYDFGTSTELLGQGDICKKRPRTGQGRADHGQKRAA